MPAAAPDAAAAADNRRPGPPGRRRSAAAASDTPTPDAPGSSSAAVADAVAASSDTPVAASSAPAAAATATARSPLRWTPLASRRRPEKPGRLRPFATGEPPKSRLALEIPALLIIAVVVALILKAFVAQAFYIPSGSMEPTLEIGDRVVVSRIAYHLHEPRRGDVVVFPSITEPPVQDHGVLPARLARDLLVGLGLREPAETELIKRVIGLPGETVDGHGGRVYIDGQELKEPYLAADLATEDFPPTTVPAGRVFVMGDNRLPRMSQDSRAFGPIPIDSIVGRAVARVWPPGRLAYL